MLRLNSQYAKAHLANSELAEPTRNTLSRREGRAHPDNHSEVSPYRGAPRNKAYNYD